MKPQKTLYFILFSLILVSCIKKVDPVVVDETHVVIFANLEYPANTLHIDILETSTTVDYRSKPIKNAEIRLYTKNSNDRTEVIANTDDFTFDNYTEQYQSTNKIQTRVGHSYWLEVEIPNRKGIYTSTAIEMVKTVEIKSIERINGATRIIFQDPPNEPNQYLASFLFFENEIELNQELIPNTDTLFDGNSNAYLEVANTNGNRARVALMHMDPEVYEFFFKYTQQLNNNTNYNEDDGGDPGLLFLPPPIQLSGNIFNATTDELVLGNFGVVNTHELEQTFE